MKKSIIKLSVFILVFFVSLVIMEAIMNQGHNNLTMEMREPTLPVVSFSMDSTSYNQTFGYVDPAAVAFQRDTVTILGENREINFRIRPYGREIAGIAVEVRSADGKRLIESTEISNYEPKVTEMSVDFALKDLIDRNTRYSLAVLLTLDGDQEVRYYTNVIWGEDLHTSELFAFVRDFHARLFDREAAKELTKYLETNSQLENNQSFHKVNIHSSFKQITWGDLLAREVGDPCYRLIECNGNTGTILVDFKVATQDGVNTTYYNVQEYYRVRYTTDRMYLLNYERTMDQIADLEHFAANDKLLLGITDEKIALAESTDGNIVVFENAGRLISYNLVSNKLAVLFSFFDKENQDERSVNDDHGIRILDVDEGGNVRFAVYGYQNRGRHEGEVGIAVYAFDSARNTIEEVVYIPYEKSYTVLKADIEQLLYMNREQQLYLLLDDSVIFIDLVERTYRELVHFTADDSLQVSEDNTIIVWQEGTDIYHSTALNVRNLTNNTDREIKAREGEAIMPLGFMGQDIIYGIAYLSDIRKENTGRVTFPMYKVCICNALGELLKIYSQEGIFVTGCTVVDNQITLDRVTMNEDGTVQMTSPDQITDNSEEQAVKNQIVVANIDRYESYVQIQVRSAIDTKSIKILTPKEVVFEGRRKLTLELSRLSTRFYVYGPYGVDAVYDTPAAAVNKAYEISGSVVDEEGHTIWEKVSRVPRNQIMAIKQNGIDETRGSMAVCLDTIMRFEGLTRDSQQSLDRGKTVPDILRENLEKVDVMELEGCNLDSVLYYVNQDIPVLAMLSDGNAVLVTGFNEYNIVVMDPLTNTLYKKGMNDSAEWFAQNGNRFVTYVRKE